ncbi:MAG: site-specific integrase [Opitutales bacterium]|nr:site-specific integrase [Opitutales bacterium]
MASLSSSKKSRYWHAVFRDGTGRQIRRSTQIEKYPTHEDARERSRLATEARRKAQLVAEAFERASRGELKRETDIRDTLLALVEMAGGPRVRPQSADEFFTAWVEDSERTGKTETTMKRYRQVRREFLAYLGDKAKAPAEHVTPDDVQGFIRTLADKGLASKSIANTLKILRVPFAEGCRMGKLTFNPAAAVKPPSVVSVERQAFTPGEITAMFAACEGFENGDEWRTAIHLGYYCGMRLGDATGLTWGAVDFTRKAIVFTPEKTRNRARTVEIPLHPKLEAHLLTLKAPDDPAALLTPALSSGAGARQRASKAFGFLVNAAGVDNERKRSQKGTGGRSVSTKSFHALRHSLTSHLAAAGVSPEIRMKFTGHTDTRTHAGYTHHELASLRAELEKIQ